MAYLGKSPSLGVRNRYYFTASGGETSISGALTGGTLTFSDGAYVDVMLNGVTLVAGTDYNTTTANTIAGLTALVASDVVEIIVYDVFSVFGGNMAADLKFGDNVKSIYGAGSDLEIYHDGTDSHIDVTGALTVDVSGDINLDAGGGEIYFQDDGATIAYLSNSNTDLLLGVQTQDKDLYIQGNDGGSTINALQLDMSAAGLATFNAGASFSGNVGIGTASPTKKVSASIGLNDTDGFVAEYSGDAKGGILLNPASGEVRMGALNSSGTYLPTFYSNNSESMRLDSTGNLIINDIASGIPSAASAGLLHIDRASETGNSIIVENVPQDYTAFVVKRVGTAGVIYPLYFLNAANGVVGSVTFSNTATAFNTSSDYRLKTAVNYDWDATTRLKQLKPARFKWIADGDNAVEVDGFLAHECGAVPEAITGTKDAMRDVEYEVSAEEKDADGNVTKEAVMGTRSVPDYQQIDQSKLVPLLCKTILELEARITALEAE